MVTFAGGIAVLRKQGTYMEAGDGRIAVAESAQETTVMSGGYLVAEISTNFDRRLYAPMDAADKESSRPDFAMPIYPGHLATADGKLNPNVPVSSKTPPTFLVQAEDDYVDGVHQSLVYFAALAKARVPVEMHLYDHGGHAFGLRRTKFPITDWPRLAETWLGTIGMISN